MEVLWYITDAIFRVFPGDQVLSISFDCPSKSNTHTHTHYQEGCNESLQQVTQTYNKCLFHPNTAHGRAGVIKYAGENWTVAKILMSVCSALPVYSYSGKNCREEAWLKVTPNIWVEVLTKKKPGCVGASLLIFFLAIFRLQKFQLFYHKQLIFYFMCVYMYWWLHPVFSISSLWPWYYGCCLIIIIIPTRLLHRSTVCIIW